MLYSLRFYPAGIYVLKVNKNTRTRCEICSKLTIKTPERQNDAIGAVLVFLLLTLNIFHTCSSVYTVNFEHVIAIFTCSKSIMETPEQ